MSKDNGKIKADVNSFDNMVAKQKSSKPKKEKDPDKISDNKLIAWFQRYWYFYKAPVYICLFVLVVAVAFIVDLVTKEEPDMRFNVISNQVVLETEMLELATKITDYIYDVNGDESEVISPQVVTLVDSPQSDMEMSAYYQVTTYLIDETYVAFIVDEGAYEYLMAENGLEKLSYYGIESDHEYRLLLNDTWFMKDTDLNKRGPFYLVFKACNVDYVDDPMIQEMYGMYVDFAEDIIAGEKR